MAEVHAAREAATTLTAKAERRAALQRDVAELAAQNETLSGQVARQKETAAPFEQDRQRIMRCGPGAGSSRAAAPAALCAAVVHRRAACSPPLPRSAQLTGQRHAVQSGGSAAVRASPH